jgi:hypothetical protein
MPYLVQVSFVSQHCPIFEMLPNWVGPREGASEYQYDPKLLPERAVQRSKHKHVPDFVRIGGNWCVSERFKKLVEELEPARHRFHPLPMFRPNGEPVSGRYFIFDNANAIDAIVPERSKVRIGAAGAMLFSHGSDLVIDCDKVKGCHVWRGRTTAISSTFFSDELQRAVEAANLKKLRFEQTLTLGTAK